MIAWVEPVVRGEMSFFAQTKYSSTFSTDSPNGGTTTAATEGQTINQTGTTDSHSFSSSATWETTTQTGADISDTAITTSETFIQSSDYGTYKKIIAAETFTTTSVTQSALTTRSTSFSTTKWSTQTNEATGGEESFVFSTTTATESDKSTTITTVTKTAYSTALTDETVGNVYDTIVLCDFSEIAMIPVQYSYVSEWDGLGKLAQNTSTGTRVTMTADVKTSGISLFNLADTVTQTQAEQLSSVGVTWSKFSPEMSTYSRYVFNTKNLLSTTETTFDARLKLESTSSEIVVGLQSFTHKGNTQQKNFVTTIYTTRLGMLDNGQSFPELAAGDIPGDPEYLFSEKVTVLNDFTFETVVLEDEGKTIEAGGNTTYVDDEYLKLRCFPKPGDIVANYDNVIPGLCYIVKPFGIVNNGTIGAFATIDETSFSDVSYLASVSRQVPFMNFDSPRALRTLTTISNDSYTISGSNISYVVSGKENAQTGEIGISGDPQTGVIATKYILGGSPESFATFYQSAPNGVFSILSAGEEWTTTCMNGGTTSASHGQVLETSVLAAVPYLTFVGEEPLVLNNQLVPTYSYEKYE